MNATQKQKAAAYALGEAILNFVAACNSEPEKPSNQTLSPPSTEARIDSARASEKLLVSTREAAALLAISERKLWAITSPRGPIPRIRIGSSVRYAVNDLQEAIDKMK